MSVRIRLEPRAQAEIVEAREWWFEHRSGARDAFDEDLGRAFDLIRSMPGAGQPVETSRRAGLRRVLLGRLRYHLYYVVAAETVEVLAFWHSSRGRGPGL